MDMSLFIADDEVFFLDDHEVKEKVPNISKHGFPKDRYVS